MGKLLKWLVAVLVGASLIFPASAASGKKIVFESGRFSLVGYLYHPEGAGPWPALIWNHGSEENPGAGPQFDAIASIFVPAGYVVFAPERRGHGESEGEYVVDRVKAVLKMQGKDQADRQTVRLLESEQLEDQLAALAYLKDFPFVDSQRIFVAGC